jgi:hypothetical protein
MTGSELNSSLLSTSWFQDTLENFLAKYCRYRRKYLLRASAASSESWPMGISAFCITVGSSVFCITMAQ